MEKPDTKLEHEKLIQEIHGLRLQRAVTILGIIGAVIAFLVTNRASISEMFTRKSELRFKTSSGYVARLAKAQVISLDSRKVVVAGDLSSLLRGVHVAPGPYQADIVIGSKLIVSKQLQVLDGAATVLDVPVVSAGSIDVDVELRNSDPTPHADIDPRVNASGNGFLWVFELLPTGPHLIFPKGGIANSISADSAFEFPETAHIFAGNIRGATERLAFVVTSVGDPLKAGKLAFDVFSNQPPKASVQELKKAWGVKVVEYKIR